VVLAVAITRQARQRLRRAAVKGCRQQPIEDGPNGGRGRADGLSDSGGGGTAAAEDGLRIEFGTIVGFLRAQQRCELDIRAIAIGPPVNQRADGGNLEDLVDDTSGIVELVKVALEPKKLLRQLGYRGEWDGPRRKAVPDSGPKRAYTWV